MPIFDIGSTFFRQLRIAYFLSGFYFWLTSINKRVNELTIKLEHKKSAFNVFSFFLVRNQANWSLHAHLDIGVWPRVRGQGAARQESG